MSRLLPEFEKAKEEPVREVQEQDLSIEQEIECPRCHDVMTLQMIDSVIIVKNAAFRYI